MSSKKSLTKLIDLMQSRSPDNIMFYRNTFAMTCNMFIEGKEKAARKFLSSLFDQLGWDGNKTYFNDLQSSMLDHAATYAKEVDANAEVIKIMTDFAANNDNAPKKTNRLNGGVFSTPHG